MLLLGNMPAGDPIKLGALATNGVFLMTSETGIIINSFQRKVDSTKLDFYDGSAGRTTGVIYHDFKAVTTIKGAVNGNTGIMAGSVGVALTITNTSSGGGVASGGIYLDSFELIHQPKNLREVTVICTQRDAVT
jgi:hypothetical protein